NLACSLLEAETLLEHLKRKLGVEPGQTTPDGRFTLKTAECLGACDTAPVVCINGEYYEDLNAGKLDEVLAELP
ncbi:MAG: NADH-quinone oxidoreductase, partial [Planctomycetes bacterium]|nr:NADH-quinone oxidoreductase [Planctomycetota bacterium]